MHRLLLTRTLHQRVGAAVELAAGVEQLLRVPQWRVEDVEGGEMEETEYVRLCGLAGLEPRAGEDGERLRRDLAKQARWLDAVRGDSALVGRVEGVAKTLADLQQEIHAAVPCGDESGEYRPNTTNGVFVVRGAKLGE